MKTFKIFEIDTETINALKKKLEEYNILVSGANCFEDVKKEHYELQNTLHDVIVEMCKNIENAIPFEELEKQYRANMSLPEMSLILNKTNQLIDEVFESLNENQKNSPKWKRE